MAISQSLFTKSRRNRPILSIIIPVFNERAVLPLCLERLDTVTKQLNATIELVFIDDGSRDGSAEYLIKQASKNTAIRIIRLSRNFGKEAALTAGLDHAKGEAVVILDADLQDPPELIPEMVKQWTWC